MQFLSRPIAIIAAILSVMTGFAEDADSLGLTAAKCFTVAPASVLSMLSNTTRLDMLDYYHAGIDRSSTNTVNGECYILSESPYNLSFIGGTDIEYQIFVLNPKSTAPVIGVIETLRTPIPDSSIQLYDSRWRPLNKITPAPLLKDWLKAGASKSRAQVEQDIPFIMSSYTFDDTGSELVITNNMQQYYTTYDTPEALGLLKDRLVYVWDGKQFKLKK